MRKAAISGAAQFKQTSWREAVPDEWLHHARGQFGIRQPGHRRYLVGRKARPFARYIKAAIGCETGEGHALEIKRRSAAASADIFHRSGG